MSATNYEPSSDSAQALIDEIAHIAQPNWSLSRLRRGFFNASYRSELLRTLDRLILHEKKIKFVQDNEALIKNAARESLRQLQQDQEKFEIRKDFFSKLCNFLGVLCTKINYEITLTEINFSSQSSTLPAPLMHYDYSFAIKHDLQDVNKQQALLPQLRKLIQSSVSKSNSIDQAELASNILENLKQYSSISEIDRLENSIIWSNYPSVQKSELLLKIKTHLKKTYEQPSISQLYDKAREIFSSSNITDDLNVTQRHTHIEQTLLLQVEQYLQTHPEGPKKKAMKAIFDYLSGRQSWAYTEQYIQSHCQGYDAHAWYSQVQETITTIQTLKQKNILIEQLDSQSHRPAHATYCYSLLNSKESFWSTQTRNSLTKQHIQAVNNAIISYIGGNIPWIDVSYIMLSNPNWIHSQTLKNTVRQIETTAPDIFQKVLSFFEELMQEKFMSYIMANKETNKSISREIYYLLAELTGLDKIKTLKQALLTYNEATNNQMPKIPDSIFTSLDRLISDIQPKENIPTKTL